MQMQEPMRESGTMCSSWPMPTKTVGSVKLMEDRRSIVTLHMTPSALYLCSFSATRCIAGAPRLVPRMPPKKKDMPRTSSMLESTEPRSEVFTTCVRLAFSALTVMIISTALPKVALSRPLMVSLPREAASSSVASPRILASGTMAAKFSQKVHAGSQPSTEEATPSGNNARRTQKGWSRMDFMPRRFRVHLDGGGSRGDARRSGDSNSNSPSDLRRSLFACQTM
mmetsp:Transcript_63142/g.195908  ORF Transcript_63142/g.195908 Transcript_63142/m.195908 type:complete len:225 (-) Transcript_63142:222-896(-)